MSELNRYSDDVQEKIIDLEDEVSQLKQQLDTERKLRKRLLDIMKVMKYGDYNEVKPG